MDLSRLWSMIINGLGETMYMSLTATIFAYAIGLPLGVLLVITRRGHLLPNAPLFAVLDVITNILRSIPFLLLMIAAIPLTRKIVGTSIGTTAAIVPLVVASFPFVARTVESSLLEVDGGVIEAAQAMGATRTQIVSKVMLREATPGLINGAAFASTAILSYSALSGAIGGGGLGDLAINYGFRRFEPVVLWACIIVLVVVVQMIQFVGTKLSRAVDHRQR